MLSCIKQPKILKKSKKNANIIARNCRWADSKVDLQDQQCHQSILRNINKIIRINVVY
jgi:hypothetical protein